MAKRGEAGGDFARKGGACGRDGVEVPGADALAARPHSSVQLHIERASRLREGIRGRKL